MIAIEYLLICFFKHHHVTCTQFHPEQLTLASSLASLDCTNSDMRWSRYYFLILALAATLKVCFYFVVELEECPLEL